jgi:hypothetical protein
MIAGKLASRNVSRNLVYARRCKSRMLSNDVHHDNHRSSYTPLTLANPPLLAVDWDHFSLTADQPILFKACSHDKEGSLSRASKLFAALSKGEDRIVDVEVGRYDNTQPGGFHQVPMRLQQYLDWLQLERSDGYIGGKQVYLAQWLGHGEVLYIHLITVHICLKLLAHPSLDQIAAVRDIALPPTVLQMSIDAQQVDLYQSALFLGPTGAVSELYDQITAAF